MAGGAIVNVGALSAEASISLANGLNEQRFDTYAVFAESLPRRLSGQYAGQRLTWDVVGASAISESVVVLRWRTTWVRPGVARVEEFVRNVLRVRDVRYVDLLDKAETEQERRGLLALLRLLGNAAWTRSATLPLSCVEGALTVTFDSDRSIARVEETIALVNLLRSERLLHRRVALDLQAFLDTHRRPKGESLDDWDNRMRSAGVDFTTVPGALGMPPMAELETQGNIISFATLIVLTAGLSIGASYLQQVLSQRMVADALLNGAT